MVGKTHSGQRALAIPIGFYLKTLPRPRLTLIVKNGVGRSATLFGKGTFHQHDVRVPFGNGGEDGAAVGGPRNATGDDGAPLAEVRDLAWSSSLGWKRPRVDISGVIAQQERQRLSIRRGHGLDAPTIGEGNV